MQVKGSVLFTNVGSRLYMMKGLDMCDAFFLKDCDFSSTVDESGVGYGSYGALHLLQIGEDGGVSKYMMYNFEAGAKYGTGHGDSQCPHDNAGEEDSVLTTAQLVRLQEYTRIYKTKIIKNPAVL